MSKVISILFFFVSNMLIGLAQINKDTVMDGTLEQVVITGQFAPTDSRATVNTVKIINNKTIQARGATNLLEVLQAEANIRSTQDGILGGAISINGIQGENIKILIDGVPVVGRLNGNIDINQLQISNIQRIEIIEGAQSTMFGSDASGGVINIITPKSQLTQLAGEFKGTYEQSGYKNAAINAGIQTKKVYLNASGQLVSFLPTVDNIDIRDQYWNPKYQQSGRFLARWQPNEKVELNISVGSMYEQIDNLGEKRRLQFKPYAFDEYYRTRRKDMNLFGQYIFKNKSLIQANIAYSNFHRVKNAYNFDFETGAKSLLEGQQDTNRLQGINGRLTFAMDNKTKRWNYLAGADISTELASGDRLLDTTAINRSQVSNYELGIFNIWKYKISKQLTWQNGARWTFNKNFGSAILPSTWISWQINPKSTLKSSLAYGYRSPSLKELYFNFIDVNHYVVGNTRLNPEKSINVKTEFAYKNFQIKKLNFDISGSIFYNDIKGKIVLTSFGPIEYEYRNIERFKSVGSGAIIKTILTDHISIKTGILRTAFYNYLSTKDTKLPNYSWSTDWSNEIDVDLMSNNRLHLNIWHKYNGITPIYVQGAETIKEEILPAWHMLNLNISSQLLDKKILIQVGCKNLLNITQLRSNLGGSNHTEAGNQQVLHWGRTIFFSGAYRF
jgi:outer membrane receptor for ferrienterochelin and colicins